MRKTTMRRTTWTVALAAIMALAGAAGPVEAGHGYGGGAIAGSGCGRVMLDALEAMPVEDLDDSEIASLVAMRQEEKLARDVYLTLQMQWGARIFANIARAEQQHMDLVKWLLDRDGIADPASDDTIGTYTDPAFEELYQQLVAVGTQSYQAALTVGATIEDLDLYDLEEALKGAVDNADIRMVYQNLAKGSRNHLRAFYGQLQILGVEYTAQYLPEDEVLTIVGSDWERGVVLDENGEVLATCGGGAWRSGVRNGQWSGTRWLPRW